MILHDIFIETVKSVNGSIVVDNRKQSEELGRDPDFASQRVGALTLPQANENETASVLGYQAAELALRSSTIKAENLDLLLFVTQNPDFGGLPHNSAIVHGMLDLPNKTMCMDVGLGCSGYVYACATAAALMKQGGYKAAMIITSDQYRQHLLSDDVSTRLLFGDWAAATILATHGDFELKCCRFGTSGKNNQNLIRTGNGISMNGRAIYNFVRKEIPKSIEDLQEFYNIKKSDVDLYLLHQGSKPIVEEILKALEVDKSKVPVDLKHTGNSVSSSLPILYERFSQKSNVNRMIMSGFGVGLSWGNMILERATNDTH